MITYKTGNIFDTDCEAIVNPVNCVGVMGAGLAKQFKDKFRFYFEIYKEDCNNKHILPGKLTIYYSRYKIISFPTKYHWKDSSHISFINDGLKALVELIDYNNIKSIAIPKLGCGLGGLDWKDVKPLIEKHLSNLDCEIEVYE